MEKLSVSLILLYDKEEKFLLQHRTSDAKRLPGHWGFFGGEVEKGETPREAVIREAFEELRHKPNNLKLAFEEGFFLDGVPMHMHMFIEAYYKDKSELRLGEGQEWGWYKASEIGGLKMVKHDRLIVERIARGLSE
jgi:8-oxo-dGTP diphosphatase